MNDENMMLSASLSRQNKTELPLNGRWLNEFPYQPEVKLQVSWEPEVLTVRFDVQEEALRSLAGDPWKVHQDSCVEFFFSTPGSPDYLNIEMNPSGVVLAASGAGRNSRQDLSDSLGRSIYVQGSHVGQAPFESTDGQWWISATILSRSIDGIDSWGESIRANFYKCGDHLPQPHFMSWSPLSSSVPDFHRPRDFGLLSFS